MIVHPWARLSLLHSESPFLPSAPSNRVLIPSRTSYHWQRILIRAPCSLDPLLALSSLPLMVRSATQIILNYQSVLDTQRQINCAWPVLARVVGAGNVLVQAVARDELRHIEAQELLAIVLYILNKLATRWQAASTSHSNFCALVATLGPSSVFSTRTDPLT